MLDTVFTLATRFQADYIMKVIEPMLRKDSDLLSATPKVEATEKFNAELQDKIQEEWEDEVTAKLKKARDLVTEEDLEGRKSGRVAFVNRKLKEHLENETDDIKKLVAEEKEKMDCDEVDPSKLKEM